MLSSHPKVPIWVSSIALQQYVKSNVYMYEYLYGIAKRRSTFVVRYDPENAYSHKNVPFYRHFPAEAIKVFCQHSVELIW